MTGRVLGKKWTGALIGLGLLVAGGALVSEAQAQWRNGHGNRYSPRSFHHRSTGTGVYVNGRELTRGQVAWLIRRFGYVRRGRYWLASNGNYGLVGGPVMGNLYRRPTTTRRRRRSLLSGGFLTGGYVTRGGATFRDGSGVTFGPGGPIFSR